METECASCEVRTGLYVLLQVASISQLTVSRVSRQCGVLNISRPYRPPWPVTGIALLFTYFAFITILVQEYQYEFILAWQKCVTRSTVLIKLNCLNQAKCPLSGALRDFSTTNNKMMQYACRHVANLSVSLSPLQLFQLLHYVRVCCLCGYPRWSQYGQIRPAIRSPR
jgi:hypothetical protein